MSAHSISWCGSTFISATYRNLFTYCERKCEAKLSKVEKPSVPTHLTTGRVCVFISVYAYAHVLLSLNVDVCACVCVTV